MDSHSTLQNAQLAITMMGAAVATLTALGGVEFCKQKVNDHDVKRIYSDLATAMHGLTEDAVKLEGLLFDLIVVAGSTGDVEDAVNHLEATRTLLHDIESVSRTSDHIHEEVALHLDRPLVTRYLNIVNICRKIRLHREIVQTRHDDVKVLSAQSHLEIMRHKFARLEAGVAITNKNTQPNAFTGSQPSKGLPKRHGIGSTTSDPAMWRLDSADVQMDVRRHEQGTAATNHVQFPQYAADNNFSESADIGRNRFSVISTIGTPSQPASGRFVPRQLPYVVTGFQQPSPHASSALGVQNFVRKEPHEGGLSASGDPVTRNEWRNHTSDINVPRSDNSQQARTQLFDSFQRRQDQDTQYDLRPAEGTPFHLENVDATRRDREMRHDEALESTDTPARSRNSSVHIRNAEKQGQQLNEASPPSHLRDSTAREQYSRPLQAPQGTNHLQRAPAINVPTPAPTRDKSKQSPASIQVDGRLRALRREWTY